MSSRHRRAAGAVLAVAALAFAGSAQAGSHGHSHKTIHLTEASTQLKPDFVDVGDPGPSVGDTVVARDGVLAADGSKAGTFTQVCTLVHVVGGPFTSAYECSGSIELADGTIAMQGPFVPTKAEQIAAVTGGTGAYHKARGQIVIQAEDDQLVVQL